jgi:hypothetical protein
MKAVAALVLMLLAGPGLADVITKSLRPMPRTGAEPAAVAPLGVAGPTALHPRARPTLHEPMAVPNSKPLDEAVAGFATTPSTGFSSLRPRPRPNVQMAAAPIADPVPADPQQSQKPGRKGMVCGNPAIKGETLAPIKSRVKGCGIDKPVRVTQVAGIRLSQPATLSCEAAMALHDWIEGALRPAFGRREVVELQIAASYVCRTRNNKRGAKISEHGRGKAIDISGFTFSDGSHWSIAGDYNKTIRKAHRGACGIFGTTLGPGSDGFHEDHLHFDVARYKSGSYCR